MKPTLTQLKRMLSSCADCAFDLENISDPTLEERRQLGVLKEQCKVLDAQINIAELRKGLKKYKNGSFVAVCVPMERMSDGMLITHQAFFDVPNHFIRDLIDRLEQEYASRG